jgi:hypothetical protein
MKNFFLFLIGLILSFAGNAQSCLPEGIVFSTQSEIDSFKSKYPNCYRIEGSVTIIGDGPVNLLGLYGIFLIEGGLYIHQTSRLTDLAGLNGLSGVGGNLLIKQNSLLNSITALAGMHNIGGILTIEDNPSLVSLTGFDLLIAVKGGHIKIHNNPALTNLTGFEQLTSLRDYLSISNDTGLTSLTGLNNLNSVGRLDIVECPNLRSLNGLENLKSITNELNIAYTKLSNFSGLDNLHQIDNAFSVSNNDELTSLIGIDKLTDIGDTLTIVGNNRLAGLNGIDKLNAASLSYVKIGYNDSLSACAVKSICDYLASPNGTFEIHDNAIGCNSQAEVDSICKILSVEDLTINGRLSVFPNPTSTSITIETNTRGTLSIFNLNGQQLLQQQITETNTTIDVCEFNSGVYFVQLTSNKSVQVGKFIKQ